MIYLIFLVLPLFGENHVIFFNGPSSSGKSTLSHALQRNLDKPYLIWGLDTLIYAMPPKSNHWLGEGPSEGFYLDKEMFVQVGPYGEEIIKTNHQVILTLLKSGHRLIIEEAAVGGKEVMDKWKSLLKNYNVLWIGIKPELEWLEANEIKRGDRPIGSAKAQAVAVHSGTEYDLILNPSILSIDQMIDVIKSQISD